MKTVQIDFSEIGSEEDFYSALKKEVSLPEYFGDNLDALWDVLTAHIELPMRLELIELSVDQLEIFEDLIDTLEQADEETEGFEFRYYLEQYE
ncbi:barstar family protein [Bergeyella zoohelcum]|uniref:barstar family protein n=1 Tax=Bergeyella zoohelcum TaxID=1015 RepID=UPI002A916ACD|nr:barstar family protein [Bergeyella zoohelcum]MDY6026364.1 barstar family protein [Bergeyella zoohelcum]